MEIENEVSISTHNVSQLARQHNIRIFGYGNMTMHMIYFIHQVIGRNTMSKILFVCHGMVLTQDENP